MSLKLRKPLRKFCDYMELRLRHNERKVGWNGVPQSVLFNRLREEMSELEQAIMNDDPAMIIAHEAADVANFAMMLAGNAGALKPSYPLTLGDIPKPPKETA